MPRNKFRHQKEVTAPCRSAKEKLKRVERLWASRDQPQIMHCHSIPLKIINGVQKRGFGRGNFHNIHRPIPNPSRKPVALALQSGTVSRPVGWLTFVFDECAPSSTDPDKKPRSESGSRIQLADPDASACGSREFRLNPAVGPRWAWGPGVLQGTTLFPES